MKIVFIDMDGVLANFDQQIYEMRRAPGPYESDPPEMCRPGFFRSLPVMPGAVEAIEQLWKLDEKKAKFYIASKHTTKNAYCAAEKLMWVEYHFPMLFKRVFLACDKKLLRGDYLIDDDKKRWGDFPGEFVHFQREVPVLSWKMIVQKLEAEL